MVGGERGTPAGGVGAGVDDERGAVATRQEPLPCLRTAVAGGEDGFAHPAELDFSRLLTFYRVRWAYEPTTFALAWGADGRPAEMFTPDFYLPDQRLYIELTTMRQRLVTRKNRKLRRLRELYPNVRIKLLYRRDYHRLLDAYRGVGGAPVPCREGRVVFEAEAIRARIAVLAAAIAADWAAAATPDPPLLLRVGRGSTRFARALSEALAAIGVAFDSDHIELSRYRTLAGGRRVRVRRWPVGLLAGRRVLLVEDVVSTGLSLAYLTRWLARRRVAAFDVCTLLDRRVARLVEVPVRYAGFDAPDELLVGFGLDLRRQFRDLPYIAAVAAE
jgi:hypoxanthine phosphoribosyltransferase